VIELSGIPIDPLTASVRRSFDGFGVFAKGGHAMVPLGHYGTEDFAAAVRDAILAMKSDATIEAIEDRVKIRLARRRRDEKSKLAIGNRK
jgi:hypothetical protein